MPTPNNTTISRMDVKLSALQPSALLRKSISPLATEETRPIVSSGSSTMMGLRKMSSSSTMMSRIVPTKTIFCALLPVDAESTSSATVPVTPALRSVPDTSEDRSDLSVPMALVCAVVSCTGDVGYLHRDRLDELVRRRRPGLHGAQRGNVVRRQLAGDAIDEAWSRRR